MGSGHAESGPEWLWPPLPGVMGGPRLGSWLGMNVNGLRSDAEMSLVSSVFCFFLVTGNWKSNLRVNNI